MLMIFLKSAVSFQIVYTVVSAGALYLSSAFEKFRELRGEL